MNETIGLRRFLHDLRTLTTACTIFADPEAWINRLALSNPVLVGFDAIGYSLYLWATKNLPEILDKPTAD